MSVLPSILGAILILFFGWLIAKLFSKGIVKLLKLVKFDSLANKMDAEEFLKRANIQLAPSQLIGKFIYWILLLLVLISASDTMGWNAFSNEISKLLSYMPKLLVAVVFFIVGTYIATFVRDLIRGATSSLGISTGKLISNFIFYVLVVIVTLTALEQGGVDTSIITSNLLLVLGAILLAAAISYGFASRDILANILASFFGRQTFTLGKTIEIDGVRGTIVAANTISVTIQQENNEKVIIPAHELITNRVKIIG